MSAPDNAADLGRRSPSRSVARSAPRPLDPERRGGSLVDVVETLLDKGLVLNADIMVSVAGVELLGIRIRAALASFETASRYGLEFPAGTDTDTVAWQEAIEPRETCPQCGKRAPVKQLLEDFCPWCGWQSAQALQAGKRQEVQAGERQEGQAGERQESQAREREEVTGSDE